MTEAELRAAIELVTNEMSDLIQTIVEKMLGVNIGTVELVAGVPQSIVFTYPYSSGVSWTFMKKVAISTAEGYDIAFTISGETLNGFTVVAAEDCTFEYTAMTFVQWFYSE